MLWTLIVLLLVFWALGLAFKVAAGAIHILLVIALVLVPFVPPGLPVLVAGLAAFAGLYRRGVAG